MSQLNNAQAAAMKFQFEMGKMLAGIEGITPAALSNIARHPHLYKSLLRHLVLPDIAIPKGFSPTCDCATIFWQGYYSVKGGVK